MADFRKLRVWQAAQALAIDSHRVAGRMCGPRTHALCDQLVRAAMSVPANIAEGSAHTSPREFARFLQYALASASELDGHVQLARDLRFIDEKDFMTLTCRIVNTRRMLHGLLKTVKKRM